MHEFTLGIVRHSSSCRLRVKDSKPFMPCISHARSITTSSLARYKSPSTKPARRRLYGRPSRELLAQGASPLPYLTFHEQWRALFRTVCTRFIFRDFAKYTVLLYFEGRAFQDGMCSPGTLRRRSWREKRQRLNRTALDAGLHGRSRTPPLEAVPPP